MSSTDQAAAGKTKITPKFVNLPSREEDVTEIAERLLRQYDLGPAPTKQTGIKFQWQEKFY